MTSNLNFLLYGGGQNVSVIDAKLRALFLDKGIDSITYIPNAKSESNKNESIDWFKKYWSSFKVEVLDLDSAKEEEICTKINEAKCIYFGGGNTFRLNTILQKKNIKREISKSKSLSMISGYSAGAVVLGALIEGANSVDIPESGHVLEVQGMMLLPFNIMVHFDSNNKKHIKILESITTKKNKPTICLPENTGIEIYKNNIYVLSTGSQIEVTLLSGDKKKYGNGETFRLP